MKLARVRIQNFKSIEDSESFDVGQNTCLVGKNEAGKTAVLTALYKLNPFYAADAGYDRGRDYPRRHLMDFDERHPDGDAPLLTTDWTLDAEDHKALAAVLEPAAAAKIKKLTISKGYKGSGTMWELHGFPEEADVVRHIVNSSSLHEEEKAAVVDATTIASLKEKLGAVATSERTTELTNRLAKSYARGTAYQAGIDAISPLLPKFLYFSQYQRMNGEVPLNRVRGQPVDKLSDGDRTFLAFCDFAGTPLEEVATMDKFEPMNARFEGASSKISQQIFKYWSQNRFLKVKFQRTPAEKGDLPPFNEGYIFRTRIENTLHDVTVPFDERSAGFVWFFSFLVAFAQVTKTHGARLILLLDEPGLSLHAKAQSDLLRYFKEKLEPKHQIIYTTHSPFMIPPDALPSVRTVEDVLIEKPGEPVEVFGTKVRADVLEANRDTLFPLQTALGYEITQSLFIGKNTLVVEGPSDLVYLRTVSEHLRQTGRKGLDKAWTIAPVGSIDKVSAFMSLFGANHLNVAVLVDVASGQKKKVQNLEHQAAALEQAAAAQQAGLMKRCHVLKIGTYLGRDDADVEDMFGAQGYLDLVNHCYGLTGSEQLTLPARAPAPTRIVKFVEEAMKVHPNGNVFDFDHFQPAEHLLTNRASLMPNLSGSAASLTAFEQLFADINALLPT